MQTPVADIKDEDAPTKLRRRLLLRVVEEDERHGEHDKVEDENAAEKNQVQV